MNETNVATIPGRSELDQSQVTEVAGGDLCSPDALVNLTGSLTQAYDNLVDFASHVIERVAGN
jgi:hypothetical protein